MSLVKLLVPNFVKFLEQHGEVEIRKLTQEEIIKLAKEGLPAFPIRPIEQEGRNNIGEKHKVFLKEELMGILETYEDPDELVYLGKVPGFKTEGGGEYIRIVYSSQPDPPRDSKRYDGWDIPFP